MDEFEKWMQSFFGRSDDRVYVSPRTLTPAFMTAGEVRRLIARLHRLSGHAPGPLPAGELEAIRERLSEDGPVLCRDLADARALLRHADALAADLAAAEGEAEGLRLLVSDLASPEGDGREAQARCYRGGAEEGRRQAARLLRQRAALCRDFLRYARTEEERGRAAYAIDVLDDAALALESPPAPAAASGGNEP